MRELRFTSAALSDLVEIAAYLATESGSRSIAENFAEKLRVRCERLASLPGMLGRSRPELRPGIRSLAYGNYVIFFRYDAEALEVINILEGHRDVLTYFGQDDPED